MKKEALRASATIPVAPTTLYFAWLNSEQHAAMTGTGAAKIDPTVGSKYSAANGYITGKLVVLDLGRRIIMSWRTTDFPRDAPDSRVEIHFEALGGSTRVLILHTDIPEGQGEKYRQGWNDNYFVPMRTYFSKYLPDPRKPPPPRRPPPPMDDDDEENEPPKGKLAALKAKVAAAKGKGPTVAKAPLSKTVVAGGKAPPSAKAPPPSKKPASKPAPKSAAKPAPPPSAKKKAAAPPPSKKPAKKPAAPAKKPPAKPAPKKPAPAAKKKKK